MTSITPSTYIASHLTLERFNTVGDSPTPTTPILALNTSEHGTTASGYKLKPVSTTKNDTTTTTLHIENQVDAEPVKIVIGKDNGTTTAPLIQQGNDAINGLMSELDVSSDVKLTPHSVSGTSTDSKIIFTNNLQSGMNQTLKVNMTDRSNPSSTPPVVDNAYMNGVKFSNDAEFTIPNPDYIDGATTPTEPETLNVRISDLYKAYNLIKHVQNYDNVISALCRASQSQLSSTSVTNDDAWIQRYAAINNPQDPLPTPLPDPATK